MTPDVDGRPLVNFAVIGPGKTGTTWLFEVLDAHPQVTMAAAKETMFFDENYERGVGWYHGLFPQPLVTPAVGEVSNTYISSPLAPARAVAYNPDLRLVTCLRDPVDRAFSNYLFFLRNDQYRGSFEEVLELRPDVLDMGRYGHHLSRWLERFPEQQLLVLSFDDLPERSHELAAQTLRFVGCDDLTLPAAVDQRVLAASQPRWRPAARMAKTAALMARRAGAPQLVTAAKRGSLAKLLYREYATEDRPMMSVQTRDRLREHFAADVEVLTAITGRDWATLWWSADAIAATGA